jgi:hypothetical protein
MNDPAFSIALALAIGIYMYGEVPMMKFLEVLK